MNAPFKSAPKSEIEKENDAVFARAQYFLSICVQYFLMLYSLMRMCLEKRITNTRVRRLQDFLKDKEACRAVKTSFRYFNATFYVEIRVVTRTCMGAGI